jgi:carbon-monoxide dehydrogenase large subunit
MNVVTMDVVKRREDQRLVTGMGRYVGDLRPSGILHAVMVRSPHAHARILAIDTAAARQADGVVAVVTGGDLAPDGLATMPGGSRFSRPDGSSSPKTDRPVLATERVRFVGEPVAAIIAESRAAALAAAELVTVDYKEEPVVVRPAEALAPGAPAVWDITSDNVAFLWQGGDHGATDAALASAHHVTRLDASISRVSANSLEPRAFLAEPQVDGRLVLHASHQNPFQLRDRLLDLGFERDGLQVLIGDVGGSFGMKAGVQQEVVVSLWAARHLARPVVWESDRTEAFLSDEHGRELDFTAEIGFDKAQRIVALKVRMNVNIGAYLSDRSGSAVTNIGGIAGVYDIPHISADIYGVLTNTVPTAAYRGAGRPEATYVIERVLDVAARELGVSPFELRRRNLIPSSAMPYKTALVFTYDCGEFAENMAVAANMAGWETFEARRKASAAAGKLRGIGVANCIEVAGGPFTRPGRDFARLVLTPEGRLVVDSGSVSVGQGYETMFPQMIADRFGIAADQVDYHQGDTDRLPGGRGNGGSGGLCVGGSAVTIATDGVIAKATRIAAKLLETTEDQVVLSDGSFRAGQTNRFVTLSEVARAAHDPRWLDEGEEPGISATGEFQPPTVTFPNGTHICEIEIDPETGVVEIERYCAVEDLGRVMNPTLASGQVHGGVAQGIGQAMGEQIVHDPSGQLITASFQDYQMPRAADLPSFTLDYREVPTKVNPLGVKGVGEAGTVGALAATMNAVNDALASVGIRHFDMPATPARVWSAIAAQTASNPK